MTRYDKTYISCLKYGDILDRELLVEADRAKYYTEGIIFEHLRKAIEASLLLISI